MLITSVASAIVQDGDRVENFGSYYYNLLKWYLAFLFQINLMAGLSRVQFWNVMATKSILQ